MEGTFQKRDMAAIFGFLSGVSAGLAYIVSRGNITSTIIWFAIITSVTARLSYHKEQQQ